ncbi:MAG: N-acetyl-alpha-D-glucosaminyl L-malate synthase BshA [Bacteroidota bacterium]|jgi:N-acetyl-alpha-D-glucosaminyl L-malate synthase BshA|uniref:N-acetyl-alpha-D-glucosaminyl L-malate synthase BshA n=1 Tax=Candidatus Pollutiaquabacter sp. TaxID=3416354 RepID=UPI001B5EAC93|nr:N-acetyl-alpha-D-glucosaminyl L-malate synthase BshA [Bacteroidota bacterium]MBP6009172.1 N-acetyl-alpha-D-glucosaminyl L-malate synthase BshA [Bacteroidia bacterium]MBP7269310.1 N-acetyl-alpha-D-glucosaminyl L-malate synthase BshA [Bacteroidia bacterium]MBP7771090.1 N-acetyl-alpha-D-glucosaminyl L-malate synthase BshA [Bacteroidia bacterium]
MKIGILCYPTFGGSGVVATELGKALAQKGHQVHFITYSQPVRLEHFAENVFYHEVTVADYPLFEFSPYETALTSKLVDVALFEKLDIVHVHYAIPHASVAYMARQILLSRGTYLPFITTLHGTDITLVGKNESYNPVVTFAINQSDAVTSVSDSLRRDTFQNFSIEKEIEVIPNFIDLRRFNKMRKDHFRRAIAPNNERLIIHASNFRPVKRVSDVVSVFNRVQEKIPAKLLLIGDGPDRSKVEKECRECSACEHIRFLGKLEAVEEILSIGDLFILPSETESFGLAALEAMACQVPVISTNTGGIPELNVQGVTGFMSNVGDVEDMARNAIHILEDDERLLQFKANALRHAREFDIQQILPRYEALYDRVLAGATKTA